jgi:hypothetical protein
MDCTSKQSSTENKKLGRVQIHIRFITVIPQPSSKRENLPCEENQITCEKSNTQGAPLLNCMQIDGEDMKKAGDSMMQKYKQFVKLGITFFLLICAYT